MCFSAEVSFGSSAVITAIGVISYKKSQHDSLRPLSYIPLLFGVQQFAEGVVWLSLTYSNFSGLNSFSTYFFIFFAWLIWPVIIPWILYKLEKREFRKNILKALIFLGASVTLILLIILIFKGVRSLILDCSISYSYGLDHKYGWIMSLLYLFPTVFSNFISSIKYMWILGLLNFISYSFSKIFYHDHVISIWCFMAAISSILILYIIKVEKFESGIK